MGRDKALLTLDGRSLVERTVRVLGAVVEDVMVVGRAYPLPGDLRARCIQDERPGAGPLGGLYTGLRHVAHDHVVVVACDLPFLSASLLQYLLEQAPGHEAVVPRVDGRAQPTHAVYARRIEETVARSLRGGSYRMEALLGALRTRWVEEDEIDAVDPGHQSFVNVNTLEEWERAAVTARRMP